MLSFGGKIVSVVQGSKSWRYVAFATENRVKLLDLFMIEDVGYKSSINVESEFCFTVFKSSFFNKDCTYQEVRFSPCDEFLVVKSSQSLSLLSVHDSQFLRVFPEPFDLKLLGWHQSLEAQDDIFLFSTGVSE